MRIATRDWIFVAVIVAVLCFLISGKGRLKAGSVPHDDRHSQFYEAMNKGGERLDVEKRCAACHGVQGIPLSRSHPPKEQCLICHKLSEIKK